MESNALKRLLEITSSYANESDDTSIKASGYKSDDDFATASECTETPPSRASPITSVELLSQYGNEPPQTSEVRRKNIEWSAKYILLIAIKYNKTVGTSCMIFYDFVVHKPSYLLEKSWKIVTYDISTEL